MNSPICQSCSKYYNCFAPCKRMLETHYHREDWEPNYDPSTEIENNIDVVDFIDMLGGRQREVVVRRLAGWSWEDIAGEFSISRQGCRKHYKLAIANIKAGIKKGGR